MSTIIQDHELERAILGVSMIHWDVDLSELKPEDFHGVRNRQVFEAIKEVKAAGNNPDVVTVRGVLESKHGAKNIDVSYLIGLTVGDHFTAWTNIDEYKQRLINTTARRDLVKLGGQIATSAVNGRLNGNLAQFRQTLGDIDNRTHPNGATTTAGAVDKLLSLQKFRIDNPGALRGLSTGLPEIDKLLDGLRDGKVYIIGARPKVGKSALFLSIVANVIKTIKDPAQKVAIFSLEMGEEEIVSRLSSIVTGIPENRIGHGKLTAVEWSRFYQSLELIKATILIDVCPDPNMSHIEAQARKWASEGHRIILGGIDHIGDASGGRTDTNDDTRTKWKSIKTIAKNSGYPWIVLSQVKKSVDDRADKRPKASDLEYSDAASQVAQAVMMLYRDERYNENSMDPNIMEVNVDLNRDMPSGTRRHFFKGECMAVYPVSREVIL